MTLLSDVLYRMLNESLCCYEGQYIDNGLVDVGLCVSREAIEKVAFELEEAIRRIVRTELIELKTGVRQ